MKPLTISVFFNQKILPIIATFLFLSYPIFGQGVIEDITGEEPVYHKFKRLKDDPIARQQFEHLMLENPITHEIPANIFEQEKAFIQNIHFQNAKRLRLFSSTATAPKWHKRGPFNVGGRTRALAIDRTNENIILAGGVSGGLWRSIDGGNSWTKVTAPTDRQSITCIAQDPRPHFSNVWYYGSGEVYGNSAAAGGAAYRGNGIYKSIDGGVSWTSLEGTTFDPTVSGGDFQYTSSIVVHDNGIIYVTHQGGISRSFDDGNTWTKVLENQSSLYTEIISNASGKLFATISNHGYFMSDDGENWTEITPSEVASISLSRTVMAAAPSNPDVVYFFAHTPGNGTNAHMLLKYTISTNTWDDRTSNLPAYGGYVGNLSQGSYNQYIKVKPNNEDVVFIGSTNLYRTTNGFTDTSETSWIGGYSPANNVSQYENHHPDNHAMVFLPSNPDIVITSHDGGVSKSKNIMAEAVEWECLNNGYYTTQAYAIAIDEETTGDARILAGFQDNGKWYTDASATDADWIEEYAGGDGCYVAIVPGEHIRYTSTQNGKILRFKGDNPSQPTDYDGIQPTKASGQLFVHPYILDPNDSDVMYYPAKKSLWFNLSLSSINSGYTFNGTSKGWDTYSNVATSGTITAVAASKSPENIVVVGTGNGQIYRVNDSRSKSSSVDHLTANKNLPKAYVSCVAVNPKDADHIVVIFSNYQTKSIYQTKDGGTTWEHVSGNLEENEDGSGAGPSVRWAEFHQPTDGEEGLFVGTSVGLYYSPISSISENTHWMQQGEKEIGDGVVTMIKTREDGLVVVATHSNGIYSAYYGVDSMPPLVKTTIEERTYSLGEIVEAIDLNDIFESQNQNNLVYEVITSDTSVIKTSISNDTLYIATNITTGTAKVTLIAYEGELSSKVKFDAKVENIVPALYAQTNQSGEIYRSQYFTDFGKPVYLAEDILVPDGKNWIISKIKAYGQSTGADVPVIEVFIYEDNNGQPSENIIYSSGQVPISSYDEGAITHNLSTPVELTPGTYWVSVAAVMSYRNQGSWFWRGTGAQETNGGSFYLIDPDNLFGRGYTSWTHPTTFAAEDTNLAFEVFGATTGSNSIEEVEVLNASLLPDENIEIDWESVNHISGYSIERAQNMEGPFLQIAKVASDKVSWVDKSPKTDDSTYYYKVKGFSAEGNASNSPIASATIKDIPNPVENLTVELQSRTRYLSISWDDNSEKEEGFYVEYSLNPDKGFVPLAIVDRNTTSYEFTNNTLGSIRYSFRVTAFNGSGKSTPVTASIFTRLEAPVEVEYKELTSSSLQFTWKDVSALETGFLIEYSTDYGNTFRHSFVTDVNQQSFLIDGLTKGFTYYFRIRTINGLLDGSLNSEFLLFVHTMSNSSKPKAVEEINITPSDSSIVLSWKDDIENELGFDILRRKLGEEDYSLAASLEYNDTTFVDLEVEKGEMYEYVIKSYNSLGNSISNAVKAQIPIEAPLLTSITKVEEGHFIEWEDLSDLEEHYVVYRQEKEGDFEELAVLDSSTVSYIDSLFELNTTYTYKVAAERNGVFYISDPKTISTVPPVPVGLSNFVLDTATQHTLTISWEDTNADEHGYMIYRQSATELESQLIAVVDADVNVFRDSLLSENTTYTYSIVSYIFDIYSASLELEATTLERIIPLPAVPYNLDLNFDSLDNSLRLTWSDSSEVIDGYEVFRREATDTTQTLIASLNAGEFQITDREFNIYQDYVYSVVGYNERGRSPSGFINFVGQEIPKPIAEEEEPDEDDSSGEDPTSEEEDSDEGDSDSDDDASSDEDPISGDDEEDDTNEGDSDSDDDVTSDEDPISGDEEEDDSDEGDSDSDDDASSDEDPISGDDEEDDTDESDSDSDDDTNSDEDPISGDNEEDDTDEGDSDSDDDETSDEDPISGDEEEDDSDEDDSDSDNDASSDEDPISGDDEEDDTDESDSDSDDDASSDEDPISGDEEEDDSDEDDSDSDNDASSDEDPISGDDEEDDTDEGDSDSDDDATSDEDPISGDDEEDDTDEGDSDSDDDASSDEDPISGDDEEDDIDEGDSDSDDDASSDEDPINGGDEEEDTNEGDSDPDDDATSDEDPISGDNEEDDSDEGDSDSDDDATSDEDPISGDDEEDDTDEGDSDSDDDVTSDEDPISGGDEEDDTDEGDSDSDDDATSDEDPINGDDEEDDTDEGDSDSDDDTTSDEDPISGDDEEDDNDEDDADSDPDGENQSEQDSVIVQAPSQISATMVDDYLRISWTDNSQNEEGFHICYFDSSSNKKVLIGTTNENTNVFRDRRQFAEGKHTYYISAFTAVKSSDEVKFEYTHESTSILSTFVEQLDVKIYPNPSNGIFAVDLDNNWSHGVEVNVFSSSGRKVYQGSFNSNHIQLNISHLYSGQYIVQFSDGEKSIRKSIIKR